MSFYYRELHDRELLSQAESVLTELARRGMLDVAVPLAQPSAYGESWVRCTPVSITRADRRLVLNLDRKFQVADGS